MLMDILNYDYNTHCFSKKPISKKLPDLYTKIKEISWDYTDDNKDSLFDIKLMKSIETLLGDKSKNTSKKNIKGSENAEIIKLLYNKISNPNENQFKCNINYSDDLKTLKIDYYCLVSIVNIIMYILGNNIGDKNFPKFLQDIENNNFMQVMDVKLWNKTVMTFKDEFNKVESLTFNLSSSLDSSINIYCTLMFYYFYKILFPNVKQISLNLNETKINGIYNSDKNPYKIRENDVVNFCEKYKNLFLSNYIITSLITNSSSLQALRIIMSESYIHEIVSIFSNEFEKSRFKEKISIKHGLIYFRKFLNVNVINKLSITINSLDRILFKEIVNLIALHRETEILELQLFADQKSLNFRKLYLNYLRGLEFDEIDPEINEKYQIIMYPYIESLDDIQQLIEEEKIPDLLFPEFRKNINNLKLILSNYVQNLKSFYLDISPYEELYKYDNYNIEILLFIYIVLSALEKSNNIKIFYLKCLNINYTSVFQMKKTIKKLKKEKYEEEKIKLETEQEEIKKVKEEIKKKENIDGEALNSVILKKLQEELLDDIFLNECNNLENLTLNMTGISLFLDLNKLPCQSLKKLDIEISCLRDMISLNEGLKNQMNDFKQLIEIRICLTLNNCAEIFDELLKIYNYIPYSLETLKISIENIIGKDDLLKILKAFHKSINSIKEKKINYYLHCNSKELEGYLEDTRINILKQAFNNENGVFIDKCKIYTDKMKRINFSIIKWPEENIKESIIFSLNKKIDKNMKKEINKNLLSRIFCFMGKAQDFLVILD